MQPGELDITPYLEKLNQLSKVALTDMQDLMRQEAALFVFNSGKIPGIINITPPFSAKDPGGRSALFAGRIKINQDLAAVFQPVKLKGQRKITTVFGRKLRKPVKVPTRERHPDVAAIYKQRFDRKNATGRKVMGRGQRAPFYVDKGKLEAVRKAAHARIGFAAAAWYQAAMQCSPPLKLRGVPAWVKKHSNVPGVGRIIITEHGIRIELASTLSYNTALDMQGKATRVLGYRQSALERRLPKALAAAAKKANAA
jgi:hypothetical protein